MSKYTEWLNEQIQNNIETNFKDFLRICAWDSTPLKKLTPESLVPVTTFDITEEIKELNEKIDLAEDARQEAQNYGPEQLEEIIKAKYEEENISRISNIQIISKTIDKYGDILAQLCEFTPEDEQIQNLKVFAMKELQANMPNLIQYANPPKKETRSACYKRLVDEATKTYNNLTKELTTKRTENENANAYIDILNKEIKKYDDVHVTVEESMIHI